MIHTVVSLSIFEGRQREMENYSYFLLEIFVFHQLVFILARVSMLRNFIHIAPRLTAPVAASFTTTTTTPQSAGV